jgi:hypothetical protein
MSDPNRTIPISVEERPDGVIFKLEGDDFQARILVDREDAELFQYRLADELGRWDL